VRRSSERRRPWARRVKPATAPSRWRYETRTLAATLLATLPASVALAVALGYLLSPWIAALAWGGVALLTLVLAIEVRRRAIYPLQTLSNLLEALREGDYSLRGARARRGDAVGEVVWEINALADTLRSQRLAVEEKSALLGKVIETLDVAVFAFDGEGFLKLANAAGERLLGAEFSRLDGRPASSLGLAEYFDMPTVSLVERSFPGASGRWEVRHARFRDDGRPHDLIVISDLSRALREEERLAWQRLLRVLGHELNNSLTPIRSMTATLAKILAHDPLPEDWREDAASGLAIVSDRAESLSRFIGRYTALARLPPPSPRPVAFDELLQRVARLEQRIAVDVDPGPALRLTIDPDQIEQALINLVQNAVDATLGIGRAVALRWRVEGDHAVVEIRDEGPGLPPSRNLFVPFFTTKPGGSGIGLVLARQIVEAHGGTLSLENRSDARGCVARLRLPLERAGHAA
jgi:two-component system nitrogen regulation sensor histidine kinase NtrY